MTSKSETSKNREAVTTAYYKWEFLRRNSEYRRDYRKFDRKFGAWIKKHGRHPWMIDTSDAATHRYFKRIYPKEYELRAKWGVTFLTDPSYTMDLAKIQNDKLAQRNMPISPATSAQHIWVWRTPEPINPVWRLDLYICLAGPKADLMNQVESAIDIELRRRPKIGQKEKKTRKRLKEYDTYLRVWDLYQSKRDFRMVAETMWRDQVLRWDTDPQRNRKNPSNPIVQRAKDHLQAARRLIERGFRYLR